MHSALSALLTGVVDYAGLFPPATLDMAAAVREYAAYRTDPVRAMLGRFVVPAARLDEFQVASAGLLPTGVMEEPWFLSALIGNSVEQDLERVRQFNADHGSLAAAGHAVIDSIEVKAISPDEITRVMRLMSDEFRCFIELPVSSASSEHLDELLRVVARTGALAKIRTGGVTADAFPSVEAVAHFLVSCRDHLVAFKATAGLHHPIRGEYRLTYEEHPPYGMMYGYLNIFVAAALVWIEADISLVSRALLETDARAFVFSDEGITYQDVTIHTPTLRDVRASFAISFGSCSFREPVDELAPLMAATPTASQDHSPLMHGLTG